MLRRILYASGSLVLLFVALLTLVGIFGALAPSGGQKKTADPTVDRTIADLARSSGPVDRQLCVVVDGQQLRARLELVMPAAGKLVEKLWNSGGPSGSDLVTALLGTVSVAQFTEWPSHKWVSDELSFGSPRLIFDRGGKARVVTDSDPYLFAARKVSFKVAAPSEEVVADGVRQVTMDSRDIEIEADKANETLSETMTSGNAPKETATQTSCWAKLETGMTRHVYQLNAFKKGGTGNHDSEATFALSRDHVVALRTADVAGDTIPAVDYMLWVSVNALAYGLAAWYLRRTRLRRSEFRNCLLCVFWLVAATGALGTARHLLLDRDVFSGVVWSVSRWMTGSDAGPAFPSVVVIDSILLIGSLAWPLIAATRNLPAPALQGNSRRKLARIAIPCLATMLAAVGAAAVLSNWSRTPLAGKFLVAVAVAGALVALSLTWLVKHAGAPALSWWGVFILGVTAVCVTAISPFAFTTLDWGWSFLPRLTYLFATLCIAAGGLILLVRNRTPWLPPKRRRSFVAVIVAVYLIVVGILVLPHALDLLRHAERFEAGPWSVLPLVQDFQSLLYVIVLFSLFVALRQVDYARAAVLAAPLDRVLGVIFVVVNFYWYTDRWLYLPVSVLLGWLLAAAWLLPMGKVDLVRRIRRERAATSTSPEREGEQLLELSRAERRHYALIAAGTDKDLNEAQERLSDARNKASHPATTLRQRFFGVPDAVSPWDCGKLGAGLGALLGIPWMALYLVFQIRDGFGYGETPPDSYPALWMFSDLFGVLTQWALLGFALGYFFPYLRGSNALVKAISLFVASTIPPLVNALLGGRQDIIVPIIFWVLQSLAFAVVLGVLMDYHLARRAGIELGAWAEIRGVKTLIGWGGAVFGAAITLVFTLAQSTASVYIQTMLHIKSGGGASRWG